MKIIVQRVKEAQVSIEGQIHWSNQTRALALSGGWT